MAKFPSKSKQKKTGVIANARKSKSEMLLLGALGGLTGEAVVGAILVTRFLSNYFKSKSKNIKESVASSGPIQPVVQNNNIPSLIPEEPKDDVDNESEFFKDLNKKINDPKESNTAFFKNINNVLQNKDKDASLKDIERVLSVHTKLLQNIDLNVGKINDTLHKNIPTELDKDELLSKERKGEFERGNNPKNVLGGSNESPKKESHKSGLSKLAEDALGLSLTSLGLKAAKSLIGKIFSKAFFGEMAEVAGSTLLAAITAPETIAVLGGALLTYFVGPKVKEFFDKQVENKTESGMSSTYANNIRDRLQKGEKLEDIKKDLITKGEKVESEHPEIPKGSTEKEVNQAIEQVAPSYLNVNKVQPGPQPWTPPEGGIMPGNMSIETPYKSSNYNTGIQVDLSGIKKPQVETIPNDNRSTIDQLIETLPQEPKEKIQQQKQNIQNSPALDTSAFPTKPLKSSQGLDISAFKVKPVPSNPENNNEKPKYEKGKIPPQIAQLAIETEKKTGVPAQLTLAQWVNESNWGIDTIYNTNPFGITRSSVAPQGDFKNTTEDWTQDEYNYYKTHTPEDLKIIDKWENGKSTKDPNKKKIKVQRKFAKYASLKDAFEDHAKILSNPKGIYAERFEKYKKTGDLKQFIHDISNAPSNPQPGHDRGAYGTDTRMEDTLQNLSNSPKVISAIKNVNEQPELMAQNNNVELMKRNPETGVVVHADSLNNSIQKSSQSKPIIVPVPAPSPNNNSGPSTSSVIVPTPIRNSDDTYRDANLMSWRNT